jgi:DNA uptake protein ComE-like DNA-binding protein
MASIVLGVSGCRFLESDNKTEEQKREEAQRTRDEVAKATERAKPALQKAGQELKEAAKTAAEQAHAAAQGVKEGWGRGRTDKLDLNSAKESEIVALPGISRREARRIVAGRPYESPHDLVDKGIISEDEYRAIRNQVTAK